MFVVNQHRQLPPTWWTGAFSSAIKAIGHTLLVLQPWSAPVPLTRSWCLWEIYSVIDAQKELTVVLSPKERELFHDALVRRAAFRQSRRGVRALTRRRAVAPLRRHLGEAVED